MKKNIAKLSIFFCFYSFYSLGQIIEFKNKIETNEHYYYSNIKFIEVICKNDSIFGINEQGCFSSFDKGLTFQKINLDKICGLKKSNNCLVVRENFENHTLFLKGNDIVLFTNKQFFMSTDWINFNKVTPYNKIDIPKTFIQYEKEDDDNYFYYEPYVFMNKYFMICSDAYSIYNLYYSEDLSNWIEIKKPRDCALINLKAYENSLYIFTTDDKKFRHGDKDILKNDVFKLSDFDKSWELVEGFNYKLSPASGASSLERLLFFDDKIFYKNGYDYVYDLISKETKKLDIDITVQGTFSIHSNKLYFPSNNKIFIYNNELKQLDIDYSKIGSFTKVKITDEFIVFDNNRSYLFNNNSTGQLKEIEKRNEDAKYVHYKNASENDEIGRKLEKRIFKDQSNVMDNPIQLMKTSDGDIISYNPYYIKSSFESKRYIVLSTINSTYSSQQIKLINAKSINIFNNKFFTYKIEDDSSLGNSPYYDEFNRDCDFQLKTVSTSILTTSSGNEIIFFKSYYNEKDKCIDQLIYPIMETFEYKINGNIETFRIKTYKGGSDVFGFIAESVYKKTLFLFTYDVKNSKFSAINLSELSIEDKYNYEMKNCNLHSIVRTSDNKKYVFLQFRNKIVPLLLDTNSNPIFRENLVMNAGMVAESEFKQNGWPGNVVPLYSYKSRDVISFANFYSDNSDIKNLKSTIKVYDKDIDLIFEKNIIGTAITSIYKFNNFIIIGGFSVDKGYVGFPNPRVIVINLTTNQITYDNVILLKNGKVDNISCDLNGNIEITTAIWSEKWNYSRNIEINSSVIFDRLDENGKFKNNLFE